MHSFCRLYLKEVMKDVVKHTTLEERRYAYTMKVSLTSTPRFEFHGPRKHYWYGQACCGWAARAEGWQAWMREHVGGTYNV